MSSETTAQLIAEYRRRALPRMLRRASDLPFYREHWQLGPARAPASLEGLPPVSKRDIPRISAWILHPQRLGAVVVSSGSTGRPVARVYSLRDQARWAAEAAASADEPIGAINIDLEESGHGVQAPMRRSGRANLLLPIMEEEALMRAHAIVRAWQSEHGALVPIKSVLGAPWSLATFAAYMRHLGEDPASLGVEEVSSYADRLPKYMREELARAYGAVVRDSYSMSEIRGVRAGRCPLCDRFHLQHNIVPEFVSPGGGAPVEEGVAMLVLTELMPDGADTPLIRYETGDIVWRHRSECPEGVESFEVLGRMRASPRHPVTDELLIPDRLIGDALARSGLVAREAVPLWMGSNFYERILEPLHEWRLTAGPSALRLQITAQRSRRHVGGAADCTRVIDDLFETWPPLLDTVRRSPLEVEVSFADQVEYAVRPKWRPRAPGMPVEELD